MEQRAHAPLSDATPPCKVCATKHFTAWREHLTALKNEVYRTRKRAAKVNNRAPNFQSNSCPHAVRLVAWAKNNKLQLRRGLNVYFL